MTTSTPTNEGVAIAATVIAQAKGDVPSARRVLGDAHRWTCTIDPSFKPDDKDKRIAELEAQVQAAGEDREWDAMRADRDLHEAQGKRIAEELSIVEGERNDAKVKVAALTIENANLTRIASELTGRVFAIQVDRDQANESNDALRDELAAIKLELANVRALNFDAPRKADAERAAQIVEPVAPVVVEPAKPAPRTFDPGAVYDRIEAATEAAKPAPVSSDPVRPANVSEGAWASMSPMMRSFAAKRAATVS